MMLSKPPCPHSIPTANLFERRVMRSDEFMVPSRATYLHDRIFQSGIRSRPIAPGPLDLQRHYRILGRFRILFSYLKSWARRDYLPSSLRSFCQMTRYLPFPALDCSGRPLLPPDNPPRNLALLQHQSNTSGSSLPPTNLWEALAV